MSKNRLGRSLSLNCLVKWMSLSLLHQQVKFALEFVKTFGVRPSPLLIFWEGRRTLILCFVAHRWLGFGLVELVIYAVVLGLSWLRVLSLVSILSRDIFRNVVCELGHSNRVKWGLCRHIILFDLKLIQMTENQVHVSHIYFDFRLFFLLLPRVSPILLP